MDRILTFILNILISIAFVFLTSIISVKSIYFLLLVFSVCDHCKVFENPTRPPSTQTTIIFRTLLTGECTNGVR